MTYDVPFKNRHDAGQKLALALEPYKKRKDTLILALPRGGVPVAAELAKHLDLSLDLMIVRKLPLPGHEEVAMGALAQGDKLILNEALVAQRGISQAFIDQAITRARMEIQQREKLYGKAHEALDVQNKRVILVDDGIATGADVRAAIAVLQEMKVKEIILAVPVCAPDVLAELEAEVDKVICLYAPASFWAVGQVYQDFTQTTDAEVIALM